MPKTGLEQTDTHRVIQRRAVPGWVVRGSLVVVAILYLAATFLFTTAIVPPSAARAWTLLRSETTPRVHLHRVAGAPSPVYVTDSVRQEQVDWIQAALQIAWPEVQDVTRLTPPTARFPVYVPGDQGEVTSLCRCADKLQACTAVSEGDRQIVCN